MLRPRDKEVACPVRRRKTFSSEQEVIGVAVDPLGAGNIVQALLAHDELENVVRRCDLRGIVAGKSTLRQML